MKCALIMTLLCSILILIVVEVYVLAFARCQNRTSQLTLALSIGSSEVLLPYDTNVF